MKKMMLAFLAIIILGLVAGVSYYMGMQKGESSQLQALMEKTKENLAKQAQLTNTPKISPTPDPASNAATATASWSAYTNTQYSVSFKYPKDIFPVMTMVSVANPLEIYFGSKARFAPLADNDLTLYVSVLPNPSKSLDVLMQEQIQTTGEGKGTGEKITINGTDGYTITFDQPFGQTGGYAFQSVLLKGNNEYTIDMSSQNKDTLLKNKTLYTQLLSTFQLTK
jgi:hypothetical protein